VKEVLIGDKGRRDRAAELERAAEFSDAKQQHITRKSRKLVALSAIRS
jgi:hypothetical protein